MKGFISGVVATGVVSAVVLLFTLEGREAVQVQQERHNVNQRLNAAEFDRDFHQAWSQLNDDSPDVKFIKEKQEEIMDLKKRRAEFDEEFDVALSRLKNDAQALRNELEKTETKPE